MPVYNGGRLLAQSLQSLLDQTFSELELAIVDNASTDGTEQVCRGFAARDPRVRYERAGEHVPPIANFRRALVRSRCEYFMWAAHDDLWHPGFVGGLVRILDEQPDVVLACHEAQYMLEDGSLLPFFPEGEFWRSPRSQTANTRDRLRAVLRRNYGNLIYGLYRRSCLCDDRSGWCVLDAYRDEESLNETPVFLQVASAGRIYVSPEVGFWKRTRLPTFIQAAAEYGHDFRGWFQPLPSFAAARSTASPGKSRGLRARLRAAKSFARETRSYAYSSAAYHFQAHRVISKTIRRLALTRTAHLQLQAVLTFQLTRHLSQLVWRKSTGRLGRPIG